MKKREKRSYLLVGGGLAGPMQAGARSSWHACGPAKRRGAFCGVIVVGVLASGLSVNEVAVLLNGRAGVEQRPHRSGTEARPVRPLLLSLLVLSEQRADLRLCSASARSAEALPGAARPTAVQHGGVDVFERSADHGGVCAGSARGAWSPGILNQPFSSGSWRSG